MMAVTHAVISSAVVGIATGSVSPLTIGLSILGSQLPDIDTSTSLIGQICFPLSRYLEKRYPHRSLTHSLLANLGLMLLSIAIGILCGNAWLLIALPLGHLVSCFSDTFTKQGVQLFYPHPAWAISVSNPKRRLRTGSTVEYYVLLVFTILLFGNYYIVKDVGGLTGVVTLKLGLKHELVKMYNRDGNDNMMQAKLKGYFKDDLSKINQKFLIIGNTDKDFYLADDDKVYRTGENVIVEKLDLVKGARARTIIQAIRFNDEDIVNKLKNYRKWGENVYVVGTIAVDFPEEVEIPIFTREYTYIKLSGSSVVLNYCPLDKAIAMLQSQYGVGQVKILIKQPINAQQRGEQNG